MSTDSLKEKFAEAANKKRKPAAGAVKFKILAIIDGERRLITLYANKEQKARENFLKYYPQGQISTINKG